MGAMSPIHIEPPRAAKSPRNTPMSTASGLPAIASHAVTARQAAIAEPAVPRANSKWVFVARELEAEATLPSD
jgi:hypothetical protein